MESDIVNSQARHWLSLGAQAEIFSSPATIVLVKNILVKLKSGGILISHPYTTLLFAHSFRKQEFFLSHPSHAKTPQEILRLQVHLSCKSRVFIDNHDSSPSSSCIKPCSSIDFKVVTSQGGTQKANTTISSCNFGSSSWLQGKQILIEQKA